MTTNLYVSMNGSDSNSGTQAAPFKTILHASQVAQPGTTVHVAPGTYAGGFTTTASGTASAPIQYVSDTKWGAQIVAGGPSDAMAAWWNKGDYVSIDGFEIDGSGSPASWRFGFYSDASHGTFQNNKVHDILTDPTAFAAASAHGSGGAGAEFDDWYGAVDAKMIGNVVYNIGPADKTSSLVHGIYESTPGDVMNNVVYNTAGVGIHLWHAAHNINIVNNTVDHARDGGILVGSGDHGATSTTGDYVTVENNIVTNAGGAGGIAEQGTTGIHNTYVDNLLYNDSSNISLQNGLTASGTIIADPKFVDPGAHDYHLAAGSPAIDAGTSNGAPTTDYDGNARPQGAADDIGAYEFTPAAPSTSAPPPAPTVQPFTLPSSGSWTNSIAGNGAANILNGTSANDYIDGHGGADTMAGGAGDDTYVVWSKWLGTIVEKPGEGVDTVLDHASTFTLPADVENVQLLGAQGHTVIGNAGNNLITGSIYP